MPKRRQLVDVLRTEQCGEMSLQRHCDEVFEDENETQKERIVKFKAEGDTLHGALTC